MASRERPQRGADATSLHASTPGRASGSTTAHHAIAPEQLAAKFQTDAQEGLAQTEAARRLLRDGPNALRRVKPRPWWRILLAQLESIVIGLLVVATLAAWLVGEHIEAIAIAVLIAINVAIGFSMEWRARREMESLRAMTQHRARVIRDGHVRDVAATEIVVGDLVRFEAGDIIDADCRITESSGLEINESAFTGESAPVAKRPGAVPTDTPLYARSGSLWKGTLVTAGSATAIATATGPRTELGAIARLVADARTDATPLQKRLEVLGRRLIYAALAIAVVVGALGWWRGEPIRLMIETAVALAVAAIPEGLPIVATLALARGMLLMARRNAVVRRLSAVETLGATSVICVDKTGTLTENQMQVDEICPVADGPNHATALWEAMVLCNNANADPPSGDPLEIALLEGAAANGVAVESLRRANARDGEIAFDPGRRWMAVRIGPRIILKGAPEAILDLVSGDTSRASNENEAIATRGGRVLAVAEGRWDGRAFDPDAIVASKDMHLLGLVSLADPPRTDVAAAIAQCHTAGIGIVMVTGDQLGTAKAIAAAVGLPSEPAMMGDDVDSASDEALCEVAIFSRVNPAQKLRIIKAHQARGDIVAMTGDGVNDAPALRHADVGVAMGQRGTAVAREASDVVLRDDAFGSIVAAVQLGRAVFANIRRFAYYLLSCNVGEIAVLAGATLIGTGLPLLPLQILYLNFVTDVFPALALGFGRGDETAMQRPPRDPEEQILEGRHALGILAYGAIFGITVLGVYALARYGLERGAAEAISWSFATLAFAQLWHVFNMRDRRAGPIHNDVVQNPLVWAAIALSALLVIAGMHIGWLSRILQLQAIGLAAWLIVLTASLIPLAVGQFALWFGRQRRISPN